MLLLLVFLNFRRGGAAARGADHCKFHIHVQIATITCHLDRTLRRAVLVSTYSRDNVIYVVVLECRLGRGSGLSSRLINLTPWLRCRRPTGTETAWRGHEDGRTRTNLSGIKSRLFTCLKLCINLPVFETLCQ